MNRGLCSANSWAPRCLLVFVQDKIEAAMEHNQNGAMLREYLGSAVHIPADQHLPANDLYGEFCSGTVQYISLEYASLPGIYTVMNMYAPTCDSCTLLNLFAKVVAL